MDYLKILKVVSNKWLYVGLILAVLIGGLFLYKSKYQSEKKEAHRWKSNYTTLVDSVKKTKDKLGRVQSTVKTLELTANELRDSLYTKDLYIEEIKRELQLSDVQLKRLQTALYIQLISQDTGKATIIDTVFVEKKYDYLSVQDSNLTFEAWWQDKDSVDYWYQYREKILYWMDFHRKIYNEKGNKRFFLWRWIWPKWQTEGNIKSTNKNSDIEAIRIKTK